MVLKIKLIQILLTCILLTLFIPVLLVSFGFSFDQGSSAKDMSIPCTKIVCPPCLNERKDVISTESEVIPKPSHKLALIIPVRDRLEELLEFIPYMKKFLGNQGVTSEILVINQGDGYRFNRASLINSGFRLMKQHCPDCDYFAMHDVDLLPLNPELKYSYPEHGPLHLAAPHLHPKYHYDKFVGGILLLTISQFELVNGMSNRYWGWGLEDDEFYVRLKQANITIQRPGNLTTDSTNTFKHMHNARVRKRDYRYCYDQKKASLRRDYDSGVNNVNFKVVGQYSVTSNGSEAPGDEGRNFCLFQLFIIEQPRRVGIYSSAGVAV
ncbi:beta-1,4-galactosyltransferase 7-like isoform X2 [Artemia franciscana]|uniref:beta-1,4-galactosyltransferase 7-like isoform X2 n=1 Tax=Artemia franciscana TaxID=6661 RepID=UPI0032DB6B7D